MRLRFVAFVFCAALLAMHTTTRAQQRVDLELILAVDVSGSIDADEAALQREGYVKALVNPQVLRAIAGGERQAIALTYLEWSSYNDQRVVVDWMIVRDAASAGAFAAKLAASPISSGRWTSIGGAIEFAMKRFAENPYRGARRIIDISGDGRNNNGRDVGEPRAEALAQGVVINGLPIMNDRPTRSGTPPERDLDVYYRDHVIGGPGSFLIVADGFESFASAIRNKLVREISRDGAPARPSVAGRRPRTFPLALERGPMSPPHGGPAPLR